MAIPSKQIGGSVNYNLLWQISKQLEQLICIRSGNCTTTTTTTAVPVYSFELSYPTDSKGFACASPFLTIYYSSSTSLINGVILYTDYALGIVAPNGWYANADTNVAYEITNGEGVITTATYCEE